MAAMVKLLENVDAIVEESYNKKNEAELNRSQEYTSSVKVQSWYRGEKTRAYLGHLNKSATTIQKRWRAFMGRRHFRVLVKNSLFIMKLNYFNAMAAKVQKVWRGYYVRKYVFDYYSRKRYLEALQIKNEIIRNELSDYAEQQILARRRQKEYEEKRKQEIEAKKKHHLVSTEVIPGIYNSPFRPYPMEMEMILRSVKPLEQKKKSASEEFPFDPAWKSYNLPVPKQLPPIPNKPQGPFRQPHDVQKQRYKPFQPSLRVSTSFTSLEEARQKMKEQEWVTRLNDDMFLPFTKTDAKYEPLLHTTSHYGHTPYGTQYFREEVLDKYVLNQPFKTVVPPIPIFHKLNDTYSQGQV